MYCVPETQQSQQAAGVKELVLGVEDPLEMSDTEQGDIALKTPHESDSSDEDIADTQDTKAAWGVGSKEGQVKDQGRATCIGEG